MTSQTILNGEEALALGAWQSGVSIVTSYPGSPSSLVVDALIKKARDFPQELYVEWSVNEKVAFDLALGASFGGRRALVPIKTLGLNVAMDSLMVANLTGVRAGIVIITGDDPSAWGSQNNQDSRVLSSKMELPILEPATPSEGYKMVQDAFHISEQHQLPVLIRIVRDYSRMEELISENDERHHFIMPPFSREKNKWKSVPVAVLSNHRELHRKLNSIQQTFDTSAWNAIEGNGNIGLIIAGHVYTRVRFLLERLINPTHFRILKIGTLFPLPEKICFEFLKHLSVAYVLEEGEPMIERQIYEFVRKLGLSVEIGGRLKHHIPLDAPLHEETIFELLSQLSPQKVSLKKISSFPALGRKPSEKELRATCGYRPIFDCLLEVLQKYSIPRPLIIGEPGCSVRLNLPPYELFDIRLGMGSSIAIAAGLSFANPQEHTLAVLGDSAFLHTGIQPLIDVVYHKSSCTVLILDNHAAGITGLQPSPTSGATAMGTTSKKIDLNSLVKACGVQKVFKISSTDIKNMEEVFQKCLTKKEVTVIIAEVNCEKCTIV